MTIITIRKFLEIQSIIKLESDILDREMKILSVVYDKPFDEIQQMPITKLKAAVATTAPLLIDFKTSFPKSFRIDGIKYQIETNFGKVTGGQYIDIKTLDSDGGLSQVHILCAIMCRPVKDKTYDGAKVPARAELFYEKLDINIAHPLMVFFFQQYKLLNGIIVDYLSEEARKTVQN
jgi:hypothetical protein